MKVTSGYNVTLTDRLLIPETLRRNVKKLLALFPLIVSRVWYSPLGLIGCQLHLARTIATWGSDCDEFTVCQTMIRLEKHYTLSVLITVQKTQLSNFTQ